MKHQGTGCDRSWLQFIGIWRKYGRKFGIPFPTKNFKLSISVTLPASQCHAAREVQRGPYVVNLPLKAWLQCYKHIHQFCRFSIAYSWNDEKRLWVHHKILSTEYHLRIVPRNTQAKETRSTAMKVWSQDSFQPISVMFSFWVVPFQISRCLTKINAIPQWFTAAFTTFRRHTKWLRCLFTNF